MGDLRYDNDDENDNCWRIEGVYGEIPSAETKRKIDMQETFFELIQVALGVRQCLSHTPRADERGKLYDMAKKQSLVGVCFAGVQRLQQQRQEPPEMTYLTWMGMAAKIQQRNEVVNQQCVELQAKLSADGLRSCVLKGQGNAVLYGSSLCMLRQSGDIDVWVYASRNEIIEHVQKVAPTTNVREHHLELEAFPDTEVEVHYWPAVIRHFRKNARLQKWFDGKREEQFCHRVKIGGQDVCVPTPEFNAIQQMAHMYHHLFHQSSDKRHTERHQRSRGRRKGTHG